MDVDNSESVRKKEKKKDERKKGQLEAVKIRRVSGLVTSPVECCVIRASISSKTFDLGLGKRRESLAPRMLAPRMLATRMLATRIISKTVKKRPSRRTSS